MNKSKDYSSEEELLSSQEEELLSSPTRSSSGKTNSAEEIDHKVQEVQSQLLELKRQQEEVEKQRRELEELSRKQTEFEEGRRQVLEKLTRGLVVLERQEFEVKREAEQIQLIRENFSDQLNQIEEIHPEDWSTKDLQSELTRALAVIDQAYATHAQARARLGVLREETLTEDEGYDEYDESPEKSKSFLALFRDGFAFTLPFMVFLSVILTLFFYFMISAS